MKFIIIVIVIFGLIFFIFPSVYPEFEKSLKKSLVTQELQRQQKRIPRIITETKECKIYSFEDRNNIHYFTVCGTKQVTTEKNYSIQERAAKITNIIHKKEIIETKVD